MTNGFGEVCKIQLFKNAIGNPEAAEAFGVLKGSLMAKEEVWRMLCCECDEMYFKA